VVRVTFDQVKHLLPKSELKKVQKKEPCRVCGNLVCTCLADEFQGQCRLAGLPVLRREFKFHADRAWRFDFTFLEYALAIEIDGGVFSQGRHTRGRGYTEDCVKLNEGAIAGWMILRFTGAMVKSGEALAQTERALQTFGWNQENL